MGEVRTVSWSEDSSNVLLLISCVSAAWSTSRCDMSACMHHSHTQIQRRGRWKWRTIEMSRHEIDGHENAGHVSGVWIGLHGTDFDLAVLLSNRLLLRFQECSRSKSKLKTIRLYGDDHCVFHRCRCFEKNCTLQCNVTYFQTIYILSSNIMSVNFMSIIFSQPTETQTERQRQRRSIVNQYHIR